MSENKNIISKLETPCLNQEDIYISIIMPVYNNGDYVAEALSSLEKQTVPYHEIIIINDGSTDNSEQVIQEYIKGKERIRYFSQSNMKTGYTRNFGMKQATGNYILFMDADDFLEPRTLELCIHKIREEDPDFVNFEWKKYKVDTKQFVYDRFNPLFDGKDVLTGDECHLLLTERFYYTVTRIYKKSFLEGHQIHYGEGYYYEDHLFFIKTALYANKVSLIHAPLYCYRIHPAATTQANFDTEIHATSLIAATKDVFAIEPLANEELIQVLNHVIARFRRIYQVKTPASYRRQFAQDFMQVLQTKPMEQHPLLEPCLQAMIRNHTLEKGDIDEFINLTIPQTKKKKAGMLRRIKRFIHNRELHYYKWQQTKPIYDDTILFMGFDYEYKGNSMYLFEQMTHAYPNHKYIFVTNDTTVPNRIAPNSYAMYRYMARSRIVIFESWLLQKRSKRDGQIWIQTWHATTVKKLLFDTPEGLTIQKNPQQKIKKYQEILNWDYLLVDNPNVGTYFETAFLLHPEQILPFGYPRVKYLIDNRDNEPLKRRIKESYHLPQDKKIVLYVPTWRDYNADPKVTQKDYSYLLDMNRLHQLLGDDYVIVFKDHHFKRNTDAFTGSYINGNTFETQNAILIADYIISDYSSIVFDAMAIDKPILIYANDILRYEACRGVYHDLYNDLLLWGTADEEDIKEKIESYTLDKTYYHIKQKYCFDESRYQLLEFLDSKLK